MESTAYTKTTEHFDKLPIPSDELEAIKAVFMEAYESQNISEFMVGTRKRKLVETNSAIANAIRRNLVISYSTIGKMFHKNHATIIHYMKLHESVLIHQPHYKELFESLVDIIRAMIDGNRWSHQHIDFSDEDKEVLIKKLRKENAMLKGKLSQSKGKMLSIKSLAQ
jgi:hypothetical protein